jgi:hypothetical protein
MFADEKQDIDCNMQLLLCSALINATGIRQTFDECQ